MTQLFVDLVGTCLFAAFMGVARVFNGKRGDKLDLERVMLVLAIACTACYLLAALSPISVLALIVLIKKFGGRKDGAEGACSDRE